MAGFRDIFERLELKFLIDEPLAGHLRRAALRCCVPDEHNGSAPGGGYEITSLYLDTPALAFHEAKLNDAPDRYKLRVRVYEQDDPAHFEIKRKVGAVIHKTRVAVARERVIDAASGFAEPLQASPRARAHLERFARLRSLTGAEPTALVRYEREAFMSVVDGYARLTFDRRVCAQRVDGWTFTGDPRGWSTLDDAWQLDDLHSPVVLELKCETRTPAWMVDLIREHALTRVGYSKYSWGVMVTELAARGLDGVAALRGEGQLRV